VRQLYISKGIDGQKVRGDAAQDKGDGVTVHYHGKPRKCEEFKHEIYVNGVVTDKWGVEDGAGYPADIRQ
jgi:hypothetical protein